MRYLILALPLLLAACATTDPDQGLVKVVTATNGRQFDGAGCTVTTRSASWNIVTPATLKVVDVDDDLRIVCSKPGYRTSELIMPSGLISGSNLSGGSGSYPGNIVINMNPQ